MEIAGADWTNSGVNSDDVFSAQVIRDGTIPDARIKLGIFLSPAGTEQSYGLRTFNFVDIPFLAITGTRDTGPPPPNEFPSGFRDRYDVFSSSARDGIGADDGVSDRGQYLVAFNNATHFDYLGNNNTYDPDVRDLTTRVLRGAAGGDAAQLAPLNDPAALRAARSLVFEAFARP
jgi:predicted dienelactone hydrolase